PRRQPPAILSASCTSRLTIRPWPPRLPRKVRTSYRDEHRQRVLGPIGNALLEVAVHQTHLVRHMGEAEHRSLPSARKGIKRGCFHLDRQQACCPRDGDRVSCLAERRIRRPC